MQLASTEIVGGLRFPEGPVALADGSLLLVEIAAGDLTRIHADGGRTTLAHLGGGPNGAAIGPDGRCYVCNNGGLVWRRGRAGFLAPMARADGAEGRIERVDLATGAVEVLYRAVDGAPLLCPNDLVFDGLGGFYFSDIGEMFAETATGGAVYYARADGGGIAVAVAPLTTPNGVGLSPDGRTLYVAETASCRLKAFHVEAPGRIDAASGRVLADLAPGRHFDSLAVEAGGNVCVGTLGEGGIAVVAPTGRQVGFWAAPERMCTNICFGGPDLKTAYVTLSGSGTVRRIDWPRPGLRLHRP